MNFDHISEKYATFFFLKWLRAAILDDQNRFLSHFSPFDIHAQLWFKKLFFFFKLQNGCRRPFWMTENHFQMHFSPFQINTQLLFFCFFFKMAAAAILEVGFGPFWMTEYHFWSHFSPFQINTQLLFFSQNGCQRPFWMTGNHFWSHFSPFQINTQLRLFCFTKWLRPFWITENHFQSHISSFQINMQLWFFLNLFWITENHFWMHFSPFQINTATFFLGWFFFLNGRRRPSIHNFFFFFLQNGHFGSPICAKNNRVLPLCVINGYAKYEVDRWICDTVRDATSFLSIFIQNGRQRPFCFFRLMTKIIGFL